MKERAAALDALRVGDFQTRWDAAKQLETYGEAIVDPLLALLEAAEADAELQWFIAKILGSLGHPDAAVALGLLLERSEDEDVREMAAQGLAALGPSAIDRLSKCLEDPCRQMMALQALTQIDRPEVVPLLLEVAQTGSDRGRARAFEALDRFADPRIGPVRWRALSDPSPEVRKTAIAGLAACTLEQSTADLVERLLPSLEDADFEVAAQTARALGRLATDRAAIALLEKCRAPSTSVQLQQILIQALGWIGSLTAIQGLLDLWHRLAQQSPLPERLLLEILNGLSGPVEIAERAEIAERVVELIRSPVLQESPALRARAVLALGKIAKPTALPALVDLFEDPDYTVRLHLVAALKQIAPELAYSAIQQRIEAGDAAPQMAEGLAIALREW
ncbi:HEAT repeat domain-containing protein [Altericista sp. CCNU0014]|uniref:HEAT repeat domain-containing protein n=1 Tax=Altericista sp. CCNU0014 TaxID=3082949 RepID=UPI00384AC541